MSRRVVSLTVALFLLLGLVGALYAVVGDPPVFFTANLAATATSPDVTPMEQALLDRINGAQSSIDAAFYDFNRASIRDALIAAKQRGVAVRIVTDDEVRHFNDSYIPYYQALENAGIPIIDDNTDSAIMHDKYFVFDNQVVWTGSTNLSDNDFTLNHNSSLVFTSTQLAGVYLADFNQMFAGQFMGAKTETAQTIDYNGTTVEVYMAPQDEPMAAILEEVNAATTTIDFAIFFFTDDDLRNALIAAKGRGVAIRGLWDVLGAASPFSEDEMLCAAGIPIKRENTTGKMHHKFMVLDAGQPGARVITGSLNWTAAGNDSNSENTLIVHDADLAAAYAAAWQSMWDYLDPSTLCEMPGGEYTLYLAYVVRNPDVVATPTTTATATSMPPTETPTATATATPTATPVPSSGDVRIERIVYNPAGSDAEGEYVSLRNYGVSNAELTGWQLYDLANTRYTFPAFALGPGAAVNVWVRSGANTATDLYWGRNSAVWNNDGDTATLIDAVDAVVDVCSYAGGGEEAVCE